MKASFLVMILVDTDDSAGHSLPLGLGTAFTGFNEVILLASSALLSRIVLAELAPVVASAGFEAFD